MTDCVFCPDNWDNLDIVEQWVDGEIAIVNPLNPVTPGHVLVIHRDHAPNIAEGPLQQAASLMMVAAEWVGNHDNANIITSIGSAATQTVMHTHVHIIPRREGDYLPLPWTPQHHAQRFGPGPHLLTANDGSQALCGGPSVCPACDPDLGRRTSR